MTARRDPITVADLRDELEALDEHAYRLQILRQRIDTSVGVLHNQMTAHDMANVRAFVREAVALWDRVAGVYESHADTAIDRSRDLAFSELERGEERRRSMMNFRLPHVDAEKEGTP
jgi:hypothetical protein